MSLTFADLGVSEGIVGVLATRGITSPSPIQASTIPDALAGNDVCGRAPTGSGKTLAFGLAMVMQVERGSRRKPRGLVLVPTRELALQVHQELSQLAIKRGRTITSIYGGAGFGGQIKLLSQGVDIVVATPGRLFDHVEQGTADLSDVDFVVIDEADRMADMGFLIQVQRLLDMTKKSRQTLLFSATLDGDVDVLIRKYQRNPIRHDVGAAITEAADVEHEFWKCESFGRNELAAQLIMKYGSGIVFCRTKHGTDRLVRQLSMLGIGAVPIHGDRSQKQREAALKAFQNGKAQALVATDVAARGIHVDAMPIVIHFDPPEDFKDYTHRSGRTGRAGETGMVVSLVAPELNRKVRQLQKDLKLEQRLTAPHTDLPEVVRSAAPVEVDLTPPKQSRNRGFGNELSSRGPQDRKGPPRRSGMKPRRDYEGFGSGNKAERPAPAGAGAGRPANGKTTRKHEAKVEGRGRDFTPPTTRAPRESGRDSARSGAPREGGYRGDSSRSSAPREGGYRSEGRSDSPTGRVYQGKNGTSRAPGASASAGAPRRDGAPSARRIGGTPGAPAARSGFARSGSGAPRSGGRPGSGATRRPRD